MSLSTTLKYAIKSVSNVHRQGHEPNVFLFATPRGGSTWVMELIASQPGFKFYDEPFNIRRDNVSRTGLFAGWHTFMPDTGDPELVVRFLNDLAAGRYPHMNPPPFRPHHRLFTNRIVFKLHELEHLIQGIARRCNGQILYLLRHPIPTTLSRTMFPRLDLFLNSTYYDRLIDDSARLREIKRIGAGGSHLQRGVVSWCYENVLPLKDPDFDGLMVAYEELVLNPDPSADLLLEYLRLPDRHAMLRAFSQPAANMNMSSAETQSMITSPDERRRRMYLVDKWRAKVTPQQMAEVTAIMQLFGLDTYTGDAVLPHPRHLHFADTPSLLPDPAPASMAGPRESTAV